MLCVISTKGRNLKELLLKISQSPKGMLIAEDSFEMTINIPSKPFDDALIINYTLYILH